MFFPAKSTSPSSGVSKPAMMRSVVVFPQPDGPSRVTKSPSVMDRSSDLRSVSSSKRLTGPWSAFSSFQSKIYQFIVGVTSISSMLRDSASPLSDIS